MSATYILCAISYLMMISPAHQADESGREFALAFPVISSSQSGNIKLFIKASELTTVDVIIPGMAPEVHSVPPSTGLTIPLPSSVEYTGNAQTQPKGVIVESPKDISLYVFRGHVEGFLAIPKTDWSTEFYVVTMEYHGYFAVTAFENFTVVEMVFQEPGFGSCSTLIPDGGAPLIANLNRQDVWGISCFQDLTGTRIISNKPISVVSGGVSFPNGSPGSIFSDFMEEMMLPKIFFGRHFVLPSRIDSVFRIIASEDNTTIYFQNDLYTFVNAGDYFDMDVQNVTGFCLESTRPILVMMINYGFAVNGGLLGTSGVSMVTVPSVDRFKTSDKFETFPMDQFNVTSSSIFMSRNDSNIHEDLLGNNSTLHMDSTCCNYALTHLTNSTEEGMTFNNSHSFLVIQIGFSDEAGFAFLSGAALDPSLCPVEHGYAEPTSTDLCILVQTQKRKWSEARALCEDKRLRLVKLDTDIQAMSLLVYSDPWLLASIWFWIGLRRTASGLTWTDGSVSNVTSVWFLNEPDNSGDCVWMTEHLLFIGWDDVSCNNEEGFICETPLSPSPKDFISEDCVSAADVNCSKAEGYIYIERLDLCIQLHRERLSWTEANMECQARGDQLLTIDSEEKQRHLHILLRHTFPAYYIGGSLHNKTDNSSHWVWSNCARFTYTHWGADVSPSLGKCAHVSENGGWLAGPCNNTLRFVCEKPKTESVKLVKEADDGTCEDLEQDVPDLLSSAQDALTFDLTELMTFKTMESSAVLEVTSVTPVAAGDTEHPRTSTYELGSSMDMFSSVDFKSEFLASTYRLWKTSSADDIAEVTTSYSSSHSVSFPFDHSSSSYEVSNGASTYLKSTGQVEPLRSSYNTPDGASSFKFLEPSSQVEITYRLSTSLLEDLQPASRPRMSDSSSVGQGGKGISIVGKDRSTSKEFTTSKGETQLISHTMTGHLPTSEIWSTLNHPSETIIKDEVSTMHTEYTAQVNETKERGVSAQTPVTTADGKTDKGVTSTTKTEEKEEDGKRPVTHTCRCTCISVGGLDEHDLEQFRDRLLQIRKHLLLDKWTLTKTIIKYKSIPDRRKSATGIGGTGIALLVLVGIIILLSDFTNIMKNWA